MGVAQIQPAFWNVPYRQNPFFTGREDILARLYQALQAESAVALVHPQSISGLGGIGKTQTALEFTYRYASEYHAILWIDASSTATISSGYVTLANLLELPERNNQDQNRIVEAVKQWFRSNIGWLLIFDNVDDLSVAEEYMPKAGRGHILLTTRLYALGNIAQRLDVGQMDLETGGLLLLRRAEILSLQSLLDEALSTDRKSAYQISQELGGLPLAIDQAGAYIKQTSCSLEEYLAIYRDRQDDLLQTRGGFSQDYPASVATTWSLSFEKISQANSTSVDLLNFCAFLSPDAIPEEILTEGVEHLGSTLALAVADPIKLDLACKEILRYSLFQRGADEQTLTMHRLVQEILRDNMSPRNRQQWMYRVVGAVNTAFPSAEFETWKKCARILPHALTCAIWIEKAPFITLEASYLLNRTGNYLSDHAQYTQAEPLLQQSLSIREQQCGLEHIDTANALHSLAHVYRERGKHKEAESLFQRTIHIWEKEMGPDYPGIAHSLHALAAISQGRGEFKQAEQRFRRAYSILEKAHGPTHPDVAHSLHGLAHVYEQQGLYKEAEQYYLQAYNIRKEALGPEHYYVVQSLHGLASVYRRQKKYEQAEQLFQQTIQDWEHSLGSENHPNIARSLHGLAHVYEDQGKIEQAEASFLRSITIYEKCLGESHPDVAATLSSLALFYQHQERLVEAEQACQRSLKLFEQGSEQQSSTAEKVLLVYTFLLIKRKKLFRATKAGWKLLKLVKTKRSASVTIKAITAYVKQNRWSKLIISRSKRK